MSNKATLWKLEQDKQELVAVTDKRMEGVLLRSRARWFAEGEKITKYCGLEKRNYIPKQMTKLALSNGEEIYESKDIIKEGKIFYEEVKVFYDRLCSKSRIQECKIFRYGSRYSYADIAGKDFAGRGNYFS